MILDVRDYLPVSSSLFCQTFGTGLYGCTQSVAHFEVGEAVGFVHDGISVGCCSSHWDNSLGVGLSQWETGFVVGWCSHWDNCLGVGLSQMDTGFVVGFFTQLEVGFVVDCCQLDSCVGFLTQLDTVSSLSPEQQGLVH